MSITHPPGTRTATLGPLMTVFRGTWLVFFVLLLLFFVVQNVIPDRGNFFEYAILPAVALLTLLGILLIFMAARAPLTTWFKRALVITGVSAVGIPLSAVLHNAVYGLAIYFFGSDVWGGEPGPGGGDEPVFFMLAIIVFPLLLIAGSIAGMVIYARRSGDVLLPE